MISQIITNTFPKDCIVEKITLTTRSGEQIGLQLITVELNIHEDLFSPAIYGNLLVSDATNQLQNLPLFGFEEIEIEFLSPGRETFSNTFRVYKISDRIPVAERQQGYIIHFTSPEMILDSTLKISKSYPGKLISEIVDEIQTEYLESSLNGLEETKYLHSVVIPYWSPFQTINWLAERANSAEYNGSNYLYFQNRDGQHFVSLESLVDPESVEIEDSYFYVPKNFKEMAGAHKEPQDFFAIEELIFKDQIDVLANLMSGMYGSSLSTYNLVNKKFDSLVFDYSESWENFRHLEENIKVNPKTKSQGKTFLMDSSKSEIAPKGYQALWPSDDYKENLYPNKVNEWLLQRKSYLQGMHNLAATVTIPGDTNRTVGQVISLNIPSMEPNTNSGPEEDIYTQGRYLITAVRHSITRTQFHTVMEVVKDSVWSPLP